MAIDPVTAAAIASKAKKVLEDIVSAVKYVRKFYGQPDGWPLVIESINETPQGWTILRAEPERRSEHWLRAECPEKFRKRFGDCGKDQYIAFATALGISEAARRGYAFILWSDSRPRAWSSLTPDELAELDLSIAD